MVNPPMHPEEELRLLVTCVSELANSLHEDVKSMPLGSLEGDHAGLVTRSLQLLRVHTNSAIKLVSALKEGPVLHEVQDLPTLHEEMGDKLQQVELDGEKNEKKLQDGGPAKLAKKRRRPLWKRSVRVQGELSGPTDRFIWRKYGEKTIQGATYRRSYYKCIHNDSGCPAVKHVQKSEDGVVPAGFDVTYIDQHTCGSCREAPINILPFGSAAASVNSYNQMKPLHDHNNTTNTLLSTSIGSFNHLPLISAMINDHFISDSLHSLNYSQPNLIESTSTTSLTTTTATTDPSRIDCIDSSIYNHPDKLLEAISSGVISSVLPIKSLKINSSSPAASSEDNLQPVQSNLTGFISKYTPTFSNPLDQLLPSSAFPLFTEWEVDSANE